MWDFLSSASTVELVAVSVFIGAVFATVMMYINRTLAGKAVRAIINTNAIGRENAKTLQELGLSNSVFVLRELKKKGVLRKLVSEADDEIVDLPDGSSYYTREKPLDLKQGRFYIREENRVRAELRYSSKGSDIFMLLISIILYLVIAYGVYMFIPFIIDFFDMVVNS